MRIVSSVHYLWIYLFIQYHIFLQDCFIFGFVFFFLPSKKGLYHFSFSILRIVLWEPEISASLQFCCNMKIWNSATDAKSHRDVFSADLCLLVAFESCPDVKWEEYNDGNFISLRWNSSKCHLDSTRLLKAAAGASYLCFKAKEQWLCCLKGLIISV